VETASTSDPSELSFKKGEILYKEEAVSRIWATGYDFPAFIAGKVAKTGDMKIDTPVATMGIRGTTPHVEISDDGSVRFSTLIEDNKNSVTEKRGDIQENNKRVAPAKRQANRAPSSYTVSAHQPETKLDKNFDINLRICRGC